MGAAGGSSVASKHVRQAKAKALAVNVASALRAAWLRLATRRSLICSTTGSGVSLALVLGMSSLALTQDFVGPHLAIEFEQAKAVLSESYGYPHFSSLHLWTLRGFFELVASHAMAGALYGVLVSSALVLAIYLAGLRSGGPVIGLLAAVLALSFAPFATIWSTPIAHTPSTLYASLALLCVMVSAQGLRLRLLATASGLLCFASLHCHVSGIAVWPIALWLIATTPASSWSLLGFFGLGLALGQGGLMMVDGLVAGDFLQSLHTSGFRQAFREISGVPWQRMGRARTLRDPFLSALVGIGARDIVVLGVLGLSLAWRGSAVVRVLTLWALVALPVVAWTAAESSASASFGLVTFAPALCVGSAHLLQRLWQQSGPDRQTLPGWMAVFVGVLVCILAVSGIQAHINHQWLDRSGYAAQRGDMFLFRLTVPLGLVSAALLRARILRAIPFSLALVALLLTGRSQVEEDISTYRQQMQPWREVAQRVYQRSEPKIAVYYARATPQRFRPSMIESRLNVLAEHRTAPVQVRIAPSLAQIEPDEFLFMDYGDVEQVIRLTFAQPPPFHRYLTRVDYGTSMGRVYLPADAMPGSP